MSEELKPCPFCGGAAELNVWSDPTTAAVICLQCQNSTMLAHDTVEEAIAAWNRRAPSVTREQIAGALCKADGTSQCAAICLTRFASDNRDGKCCGAVRVWGRKADAILALLRGEE